MTARGRFVTFEGGEGAGKSTQIERLAQRLRTAGFRVRVTREPGGPKDGAVEAAASLRKLLVEGDPARWSPRAEALLNYAQRVEHVNRFVLPALVAGDWVLCDRFADSTMAYQGYGHRLGAPLVRALHRASLGAFKPDFTLVLDIPVATGLARAGARAGVETRFERYPTEFHERVRRGFRAIARAEPKRCALIDARGAADTVEARIAKALAKRFPGL
ncbi:MAG: dTMP kinase [Tagaea sp.]|jgi:dTMP kinase|nr:dTMP kinase [Magnetospirillum sp.]